MAVKIYGKNITVYTSNGGGESLLQALGFMAKTLPASQVLDEVLDLLVPIGQTGNLYLEPVPPEISTPAHLTCLAKLIRLFIEELAKDSPNPAVTDIDWNKELRLWWLAKMLNFYDLIRDTFLPEWNVPPPIELELSKKDRLDCKVNCLKQLCFHHSKKNEWETLLDIFDSIIALRLQEEASKDRDRDIAQQFLAKADIFEKQGNNDAYKKALKQALAYENDFEMRQAVKEEILYN